MKPGDKIYRVIRNKFDGKWYFCVYEYIHAVVHIGFTNAVIEVAPILTFYESNYKSHSTFQIKKFNDTLIDEWVRDWDYITNNEYLAISVYKEKIKDENNTENEVKSRSNY